MVLDARLVAKPFAPYDLVKTMRASILTLGPLLARFGEARVSLPGGCAIGERPVDLHIKGLRRWAPTSPSRRATSMPPRSRLKGARIFIDPVTVTGTENLMMAACLADGTTVLENAAREPEVVDLARCLIAMGARISGHGTRHHHASRASSALHGVDHAVMPDRIETGTFLAAAAATRGSVTLTDAPVAAPRRGDRQAARGRRSDRSRQRHGAPHHGGAAALR